MTVKSVSFTFARPTDTTAYAAGDLVANSTTIGQVVMPLWTLSSIGFANGFVRNARLRKSNTTVTNAQFSLALFNAAIPLIPAVADNAAMTLSNDVTGFLGSIAFDLTTGAITGSNGVVKAATTQPALVFNAASGQAAGLQGVLTATAAYTPASAENFEVILDLSDI